MKKIINDADCFVDEIVEGILLAHPHQLKAVTADHRALVRVQPAAGRVGIVTGGGSGHLPFFLGYVGAGLASAVAIGNIFSSPSAQQVFAATKAADEGAGVVYLYGNYGGDVYNFDLAGDLAETEGISTRTVIGTDDVMSAPPERANERRGVAGLIFAYKTAGAAADQNYDLAGVAEIAQRTVDRTRTMGVGLSPTILPAAGEPTFTLDDGEMEVGIGIHGEPGHHRGPLESADSITQRLLDAVLPELDLKAGDEVAVLVNGMGATPLEELYVMYRHVHRTLTDRGITIRRRYVGEYTTSLEMAGASISVLHLDDELAHLLEAPAHSPFFAQGRPTAPVPQRGEGPEPSSNPPASVDGKSLEPDRTSTTAVQDSSKHGTPDADKITDRGSGAALRTTVLTMAGSMAPYADELRELDSALGDGDLGVTVTAGAQAVEQAISDLPEDPQPAEVIKRAGAAFATGNPSTFAALLGGGLLAGSQALQGSAASGAPELAEFAAMTNLVQQRVQERGHAAVGDKTFVDVLQAISDVLAGHHRRSADSHGPDVAQVLEDVVNAAENAVEAGAGLPSRRGRASWIGSDGQPHKDPGSVAVLRMLQELRYAM